MNDDIRRPVARPRSRTLWLGFALLACLTAAALTWGGVLMALLVLAAAAVAYGLAASRQSDTRAAREPSGEFLAGPRVVGHAASPLFTLVEGLEGAALLVDVDAMVRVTSRGARELFPLAKSGMAFAGVTRNPDLQAALDEARTVLEARTIQVFERLPVPRRMIVTITPVAEQGAAPLFFLQFRDHTEQDRLAQMRSDFIANASHELRTPLASLKGFIETLRGPARDDAAARARFLAIMETQAARMARILDNLLSLSRIEMHVHLPPRVEAEVGEIVSGVVKSLEPLAAEARIALHFLPGEGTFKVRGDRDELEQVFQNLIHNALKYGREDGKVEVAIARRESQGRPRISVSVADDGPGIAEEHLPRLTERFYRVDTATSRERGGTGLGLAIVKHVLTRHRGELDIASKIGAGSTFTVTLPALDPDEATPQRSVSVPAPESGVP